MVSVRGNGDGHHVSVSRLLWDDGIEVEDLVLGGGELGHGTTILSIVSDCRKK